MTGNEIGLEAHDSSFIYGFPSERSNYRNGFVGEITLGEDPE
jgi:hypothetical protein